MAAPKASDPRSGCRIGQEVAISSFRSLSDKENPTQGKENLQTEQCGMNRATPKIYVVI
jgi:hypothetical protein